MIRGLAVLVVFYALLVATLYAGQRRLMYHPVRSIAVPQSYGLAMCEHEIVSADGTKLALWVADAHPNFPTLIYFHGNAGNLADRATIFKAFINAGFGVVALEYRGFGKSAGSPSEQGFYTDARATIDYAQTQLHLSPTQLIYYGESLGSGVAVQMATERPPAVLMLEAAYTSVATRSGELFPYILGIDALVRDRYDSLSKIGQVHVPLVMIHGQNDPVIPLRHAQLLFAAANEPKQLVVYKGAGHVDFNDDQRIAPLLAMLKRAGAL